jgi:HAD superfamily hydrolase (TIGR01484 family)
LSKINVMCDIDGCIVPPRGDFWDFAGLMKLAELLTTQPIRFSLCSGRPAAFAECLSRQLMIDSYCICENGSVLMHPHKKIAIKHPLIPKSFFSQRQDIEKELRKLQTEYPLFVEFGKEVMFSVNTQDKSLLEEIYRLISDSLRGAEIDILNSGRSIEIIPKGVGKGEGLMYWAELEKVSVDSILAIGDADNDLSILQTAGTSGAPANCTPNVRQEVDLVSDKPMVQGVIDLIQRFRAR